MDYSCIHKLAIKVSFAFVRVIVRDADDPRIPINAILARHIQDGCWMVEDIYLFVAPPQHGSNGNAID